MNTKTIIRRLEKERNKIALSRDALRDLQYEVNALFESCEEGLQNLDEAIDKLSELA